MGKRPRTPHFISGIGDGSIHADGENKPSNNNNERTDDLFIVAGKNKQQPADRYIRSRNERLFRLEEPLLASDHWRDVFANDVSALKPSLSGAWQVSAFALLGVIVVLSAVFLHFVTDNSDDYEANHPYSYRRRQRHARRMYKTRKKKTDEWSDDEEPLQNGAGISEDDHELFDQHPYYYHPSMNTHFSDTQDPRLRRSSAGSSKDPYTPPPQHSDTRMAAPRRYGHQPAAVPRYMSPSVNMPWPTESQVAYDNTFSGCQSPAASRGASYSSGNSSNFMSSPTGRRGAAPLSGRYRVPTPPGAKDIFPSIHNSTTQQPRLATPPEGQQLTDEELGRRPDHGNLPDSAAMRGDHTYTPPRGGGHHERQHSQSSSISIDSMQLGELLGAGITPTQPTSSQQQLLYHDSLYYSQSHNSFSSGMQESHNQGLLLSPGNFELETPRFGNKSKVLGSSEKHQLEEQPMGVDGKTPMPFIPMLEPGRNATPLKVRTVSPPRSVVLDELRLIQMETGNSGQWDVRAASFREDDHSQHEEEQEDTTHSSLADSDISIPSGDPRKNMDHKRKSLEEDTNAAPALQSSIKFEELELEEVIGGGGFGQVWKGTWVSTPVAVKVLTGSAQNKKVAKAILEEFNAEINLLKGMRHPNICLYMGACVDPPNRAIVTELAANGSVWDALRLPLVPPFVAADGTSRGAWPVQLYTPGDHGAPPSSSGVVRTSAPNPPKGTWPWKLVKHVALGAARGMAYLHNGKPPVLHRDLKSANLLLGESYNTKVCDFGLSRLKAQERSMTGNCGTVQWMAPEMLANQQYNEKADIFSFGIILWELLSRECPYDGMTAIQCALAVLNRDKRPEMPRWCPPAFHALIKSCLKKEPSQRPSFEQIIVALSAMGV